LYEMLQIKGDEIYMSKEHWDASFSDIDYVYGETANEFIQSKHHLLSENSKIACFAEGEGRNAVYLAKLGHQVTAYDQSDIGLEKTNTLADKNGVHVTTIAKDLIKEKVDENKYDAAIMVFGHVPKEGQDFLISSLINSVKPGGYITFEVYSENQLPYKSGGPPSLEMLYNPQDILEWI